MIKSFGNSLAEDLFCEGKSKRFSRELAPRAVRKLDMIDAALRVEDLLVPPGNRLHSLRGSRMGQYSISINDQWRICFRFEEGNAYDVEVCDYH